MHALLRQHWPWLLLVVVTYAFSALRPENVCICTSRRHKRASDIGIT